MALCEYCTKQGLLQCELWVAKRAYERATNSQIDSLNEVLENTQDEAEEIRYLTKLNAIPGEIIKFKDRQWKLAYARNCPNKDDF